MSIATAARDKFYGLLLALLLLLLAVLPTLALLLSMLCETQAARPLLFTCFAAVAMVLGDRFAARPFLFHLLSSGNSSNIRNCNRNTVKHRTRNSNRSMSRPSDIYRFLRCGIAMSIL